MKVKYLILETCLSQLKLQITQKLLVGLEQERYLLPVVGLIDPLTSFALSCVLIVVRESDLSVQSRSMMVMMMLVMTVVVVVSTVVMFMVMFGLRLCVKVLFSFEH